METTFVRHGRKNNPHGRNQSNGFNNRQRNKASSITENDSGQARHFYCMAHVERARWLKYFNVYINVSWNHHASCQSISVAKKLFHLSVPECRLSWLSARWDGVEYDWIYDEFDATESRGSRRLILPHDDDDRPRFFARDPWAEAISVKTVRANHQTWNY